MDGKARVDGGIYAWAKERARHVVVERLGQGRDDISGTWVVEGYTEGVIWGQREGGEMWEAVVKATVNSEFMSDYHKGWVRKLRNGRLGVQHDRRAELQAQEQGGKGQWWLAQPCVCCGAGKADYGHVLRGECQGAGEEYMIACDSLKQVACQGKDMLGGKATSALANDMAQLHDWMHGKDMQGGGTGAARAAMATMGGMLGKGPKPGKDGHKESVIKWELWVVAVVTKVAEVVRVWRLEAEWGWHRLDGLWDGKEEWKKVLQAWKQVAKGMATDTLAQEEQARPRRGTGGGSGKHRKAITSVVWTRNLWQEWVGDKRAQERGLMLKVLTPLFNGR